MAKMLVIRMPKYVTKLDNMKARKRWYDTFRTTKLDHIAADIVEGIRAQQTIGGVNESFLPFAELLSWIPTIYRLQQSRVHDIVGLTRDGVGLLWVTCSCGLTSKVPDQIARNYSIPIVFLCTAIHRDSIDAPLESWFYLETGHRDPFYGDPTHAFVAVYGGAGSSGLRRQLVCTVCRRELGFTYSGKFALFRPETYARAVSSHLSECAVNDFTNHVHA